jgi:hypothetical protein
VDDLENSSQAPTPRGRSLLRGAGRLVAAGILAYLVLRLARGWDELAARGTRIRLPWLAAAQGIYIVNQLIGVSIWSWMVGRFVRTPPYRDAVAVCGRAWIGRYLPGKLWVVGGKVILGARLGIPKRVLGVVSLTELALILLVCGTFGAGFLLAASLMGVPELPVVPAALALLIGFLAITPPVFRRVLNVVARLTRRRPLAPDEVLSVGALIGASLRWFGMAAFGSTIWVLYLLALLPPERLTPELVCLAIGAGPIGAILGMIAVFAPAGVGVREGVQVTLLSILVPVEEAIALALLARMVNIVGDVVFFGIAQAAGRGDRKRG